MSKLETNIINKIKLLSMEAKIQNIDNNWDLCFSVPTILSTIFLKQMCYNPQNPNWINKDRLVVSKDILPILSATLKVFGKNVSQDSCNDIKNYYSGEVLSTSIGIALGERYLKSLVKLNHPKSNIVNFRTYCICTYDELVSGLAYESLEYLGEEKLKNLIILVIKDKKIKDDDLVSKYNNMKLNVLTVSDNTVDAINESLEEAKDSKKATIIFVSDSKKEYKQFEEKGYVDKDDISKLKLKYKISDIDFNKLEDSIQKVLEKRVNKIVTKWQKEYDEICSDKKVKPVMELLENRDFKLEFNADNLKINDNYEEELTKGNNKIFNILANKTPFILNLYLAENIMNISNSMVMSNLNQVGRNISFKNKALAMGGVANGLASLGLKIFISAPILYSNMLKPFEIKAAKYNMPVNYVYYNDEIVLNEINSLRIIDNLITLCPADINEIIGVYSIVANYKKSFAIVLSNHKKRKIAGTNSKYVIAGAYRIKREKGEANGVLVATGKDVDMAEVIAEELIPYGIDLRVVSMPSMELYEMQNERYRISLFPAELNTFIIEEGDNSLWQKYVANKGYVFSLNNEIKDKETIKNKIIEIMKNN